MKVRKPVKRRLDPPPDVAALITYIADAPDAELLSRLKSFTSWLYPRGDLTAWINVLDRLDDILAGIITEYQLDQLQTNDFSAQTKELLLEVLRVLRLLLDNTTNRRAFASYDRLSNLLLTSDLDVLHSTIFVLLRPSQAYANQTPFEPIHRHAILHRLLTLSRGWERITNDGISLVDLLSPDVSLPADIREVSIQYYPLSEGVRDSPDVHKRQKPRIIGPSTLDLGNVVGSSDPITQLKSLATEHRISLEDQYVGLQRLRLARMEDHTIRHQLLTIRLLALATYVFISNESAAQSALFLYEPELINQLSDLVRSSQIDTVTTGAIHALYACAHHNAKSTEVLSTVCANVGHGSVISRLRLVVEAFQADRQVPYDLVDALIAFIAYIVQSPSHSNMLIGAGILRVLLDVPTTTAADRDQYIPRMTGLLDSFIFSTTQSHSNFSAIDGVNTLVSITKTEIERRVSTVDPTPTSTLSSETISSSVNSPLKGVLRSLQRLLSASGGTEGLRNLVDSELPKCLKRIFEQPGVFGTRVYALAIQTMATFVHNEPTSLSILQELDLPQTLYTQLELGIPASPEVISMVNNAIGAVCLNQAGLDHTIAHPKVVTNLVDILLQSSHANILNERDHAKNLGASLDELSRHQPLLRPIIMRAVIAILRRVRADASAFVPPEKEKRDYSLNAMTSSDDAETQPVPTNDYLLAVLRIFRVLSSLLSNKTTSKDFVDAGGITHLLDLSDSPCLPVRFGPTQAGNAFTTLLKHIAEHDHIKLLETIIGAVQATIPLCNPLFEDEAHWAHLHTGNATPELRDSLTALQQLMIRLMFLTEALSFNTNSQARAAASILRLLNETNIMIKLGKIHRVTYRQHTLLQRGKKSTNPPNPAEDFARDSGAQFAATKVNTMLAKIFKTIIKLIFVKRSPDPSHALQAYAMSNTISDVIIEHLRASGTPAVDVMSLGVATLMLFDGRGRGTEPQLHTTLFLVFMSKGGFGCLLDLCKTVIAATDGTADTTSGIRVVLALLNGFASTESLIENPETHALQQRPQKPLPAVDLFVIIRSSIFPLANEIWSAEWLVRCPLLTMKLALRCFSTLMSGKSEDPPSTEELAPQAITSSVHRHSPLVADPGRVEQLVDMGFARSVAERALVRARNDVANAAELLLSMAHLFEDAPVAAQAEPQSQPSAEHSELPTVAESVQQETPPTPPDIVDELEDIIKSASSSREALERLRADNRSTVSSRALIILDHAEELVNDALPLFPEGEEGIAYILEKLFLVASSTVDEEQPAIASRLRLASVHIRSTERPLDDDQTKKAVAILASLPLETNPRPKWFPAMLSFAETVYASSIDIVKAKIGDPPDGVLLRSVDLTHVSSRLATIVYALVSDASTSRDELIASLRLLVLLTRVQPPTLEQALQLLNPFKQSSDRLSGCHPLVLLIMRHAFEDKSTLTENMRREIRHWLSPSSSKVVDINVFVQKLRQVALREATCFVKAVEEECALIDPKPPQSVYHITTKATQPGADPVAKPSDPFVDNPDEKRNPLIDHLVLETGMAVRASLAENGESHTYAGFLMSILCELVGSYTSTKKAFLTSLREQGFGFKTRGVGSLITDMVCSVSFAPDITGVPPFDGSSLPARRLAVSSWASTLILALCADIVPSAAKGATDDLIATRKVVIDAIAKSLRDTNLLADLPSRFGRLWAIGELVHRLLKDQPGASRQAGEYSLQMAKIMLEKNFVSLLTNALGELDLNYPDVRNVLVNLLRALDHLSKMSVKYGKPKSDPKNEAREEVDDDLSTESEVSEPDSDIDMINDDESAPDMYRNSALGMIGGELGDEDEEDMDEEDEDDDMDLGDDLTDDEGGTETEDDDESMGSGLEPDNWTDDDDLEGEEVHSEDMEQEVVLGSNEDSEDDEGGWEDAEDEDDGTLMSETQDLEDEEEEEEDMSEAEGLFLDENQEGIVFDGEEDFNDLEIMDAMPMTADTGVHNYRQSSDVSDPWGWQRSTRSLANQRQTATMEPSSSGLGPSEQHPSEPTLNQAGPAVLAETHVSRLMSRSLGNHGADLHDLLHAIEDMGGTDAVRILENMISRRQRPGSQAIRIDFAQDETGHIGLTVNGRSLPLNGHVQQVPRNVDLLLEYAPRPTKQRWLEEMNLATTSRNETSSRLVIHLVNRLLPDARRRADEEDAKNKIADHGATEVLAGRQVTQLGTAMDVALPASQPASPGVAEDLDVAMNDTADHAAAQAPRTVIFIHGREVDITDTGIDLDFLEALPDEMRADVVEQHLREHARHRRPVNPSVPESVSQLNAEFLDALPPDIRTEVIMQEAIANARRQNPPPAAAAAPAVPVPASSGFLAALSDELREVIMSNSTGNGLEAATQPGPGNTSKKTHREALLLLDKPGIASLVRLLFFPETLKKGPLFRILVNLCENTVSRTDLLNLLLSVVQDGSGDLPAVDKSFQQLSLRGVVTPKATPKSKNVESPAPSLPNGLFSHLQTEHVPTFIAQRCFEALAYIVATNSSAVTYFLTEHEQPVGLRKSTKQGKGKEKSIIQTKFPIVVLLGLLDRPLLAKTPNMMETLTSLLATITKPLADASEHLPRPIVPPSVLRLVVNCLTEGECTSRTFSQSLLAMRHLAYLSGAKEVLLQELRTRSKDLGRLAHEQLVQLSSALEGKATEIDSDTLANFFPPTSIQAQLLRLLKAIDYLYLNKVNSDAPQSQMTEDEKAVGAVFESFDFKSLWDQLGYCLNRVEERGDTDQIATVLLPLVEALMVISKYHGESPREIRSPSVPPAESDLFVSFTTAHRKVLNTIVRNNPSLLSGSFSLLIRNSRVLEFDNKRNWFFQKLKRKRDTPAANSVLKLNVRRQYVFDDSFHALQRYTGDEVKYGKLTVKFYHEDGVDAGGVTREWYSVLAQQIFDPNFALFEPCAADQRTYQPNKASSINGEHLAYFKFVGRIIGKAVYDGRLLDAYFNRAFYKQILGRTVDMRDLESIDPEYHKSLQWMLENDITDVIDQEFTIEDEEFGEKKIVELKRDGASIPVTEENKEEYVRLVVSYRLDNSIKDQIKAFLEGFYDVIPRELIQIFEPDQLELLISGITTVDVDELKNATQLSGWKATDPEIAWFWRALRSFSQEERSRFLMFVTSSSRVPLGGFTQLQGSSGIQPFQIQKLYAKEGSLPQASTCFNLLLLPSYGSYEQLRERLQFAIVETGGFGKA